MSTLIERGFTYCTNQKGFSEHAGPYYEKIIDGLMHRAMDIEQYHLNPEGVVHGGVLLSLADYAVYRAIGDEIGHQIKFATINLNSNFVAAAKPNETLLGIGSIVRKTKSVIFAEGRIFTENKTILQINGIWKIIGAN